MLERGYHLEGEQIQVQGSPGDRLVEEKRQTSSGCKWTSNVYLGPNKAKYKQRLLLLFLISASGLTWTRMVYLVY